MSAFKTLRDVCLNFEEDLRRTSNELFAAKVGDSFEDGIAKKLRDLSLHTAKLRLLQATPTAATPEIANQQRDDLTAITDYTATVHCKLIEQQVVKAVTQAHAVKELISASDSSLEPDMVERKEKILKQMFIYRDKELHLLELEAELNDRYERLAQVREEWDEQLASLRQMKEESANTSEHSISNPLLSKLNVLESKTRLVRALLARLVLARNPSYDWLSDPHHRLRALILARQCAT